MKNKLIFVVLGVLVFIFGSLKPPLSSAATALSEKDMNEFFGGACNQRCVEYEDCGIALDIVNCSGRPSCDGSCLACSSGGRRRGMCETHAGSQCTQTTPSCGWSRKGICKPATDLVCTCIQIDDDPIFVSCGNYYRCE